MSNSQKITIRDAKDLYSILPEEFRQEFSIGMHGFQGTSKYWIQDEKGNFIINQEEIQKAKDGILSQGLKFNKERTLLSTVSFGDLSEYVSARGSWSCGGVIIALPKVMRSESGKEMFVGSPNEGIMTGKRNHQITSLSEVVLPEDGRLDPMFIIGSFTKNGDEIEVTINPNHIAFNRGKVPDDFFDEHYARLTEKYDELGMNAIEETMQQQREYKGNINETANTIEELTSGTIRQIVEDSSMIGPEEQQLNTNEVEDIPGIAPEKANQLRMAIQEARDDGLDNKSIKSFIFRRNGETVSSIKDYMLWGTISGKYGIDDMMIEDYMSQAKGYSGVSTEMRGIIDSLTQEEIQEIEEVDYPDTQANTMQEFSLTELGKKSYQHFGIRIAEKLKETMSKLKSRFLSKNQNKSSDLDTSR